MMADEIEFDEPTEPPYVPVPPERAVRNPRHTADAAIDCEVEHEVYGWIPYTATVEDTDLYGAKLYQDLINGEHGTIEPYAPTPQRARALKNFNRDIQVEAIQVTTNNGHVFNGDEDSQNRMSRAIVMLRTKPSGTTIKWVLANNAIVNVGTGELVEALTAAFAAQTAIWTQP
jgi:hypothetical protein